MTIAIIITGTDHVFTTPSEAKKFLRTHVVIAKADIKKIRAWAKKNGMLKKLQKELPIKIYPLAKGRGGDWGDQ
jgi:hypothetical protein